MKGLILVHQGHREEGTDLVKTGMRYDLTSHIVWHVFGLIQKAEKKYEEALKSYTQALRFDKVKASRCMDAFPTAEYLHRKISTSSEMQRICKHSSVCMTPSSRLVIHFSNSAPMPGRTGSHSQERSTSRVTSNPHRTLSSNTRLSLRTYLSMTSSSPRCYCIGLGFLASWGNMPMLWRSWIRTRKNVESSIARRLWNREVCTG